MSVDVVKIENLTKCTWAFKRQNNVFESNNFFAPVGSNTEWKLTYSRSSNFIRLTLLPCNKIFPFVASVSLRIVNKADGEIRLVDEDKLFFNTNGAKDYSIKKAFYETDVICELRFDRMELVKHLNCLKLQEYNDSEPFIKNEHLSDITLELGNKKLRAHKVKLAENSGFFAEMFELDTVRKIILINEISEEVALEMIRFIYTGEVSNLEKCAEDLFLAADHYKINNRLLKDICEVYLSFTLTVENTAERLLFAEHHSANYLKTKAIQFITSNKNAMSNSWNKIPPHLIQEIFENVMDKHNPSSKSLK